MFSQISDVSGFLEYDRFTDFLQQVIGRNCSLNYSILALTTAVFEAPTFGFSEGAVSQCFSKILALTTAVFEAPTFGFSEGAVSQCFSKDQRVTLNNFLDVFMSDPCPPCVMWLPLLHRMASVEHVYHPVVCDACQVAFILRFIFNQYNDNFYDVLYHVVLKKKTITLNISREDHDEN
ncbi:EF-hand [Dictyocaulus viviparus]|uniref:EF-hand n=1 Tax=Dictyocaulus viviparus TaxID=29172 RepID=A0A0D8XF93_DICVI|nr:EF-hand [Dictyocaulus viviparus]